MGKTRKAQWGMRSILAAALGLFVSFAFAAGEAVLLEDRFADLSAWTRNETIQRAGSVESLKDKEGGGVQIAGTDMNSDAAIWREIDTAGAAWIDVSVELMHGVNTGAGLIVTPLDAQGKALKPLTPFKIGAWNSTRWDAYEKTLDLPEDARKVRISLSVLNGRIAFRNLVIRQAAKPRRQGPRESLIEGMGFEVERFETPRPAWEIHAADLDGNGREEIVACDVDGVITARDPSQAEPRLRLDAGALVYDFAVADVNGDGRPEILFTTVEKDRPLEAVDLTGRPVRRFDVARGPRKICAGDMDGDGRPELAVNPGLAGGAFLMDCEGKILWQSDERISDAAFGHVSGAPGRQLIVMSGAPRLAYWIVDRAGKSRQVVLPDQKRLFNLAVRAADVDGDGADELAVLRGPSDDGDSVTCLKGEQVLWTAPLPEKLQGSIGFLEAGDFHPETPGLEIVAGGSHVLFLLDNAGALLHRSADETTAGGQAMRQWDPGRLLIPDLACAPGKPATLWAASSRLRDPAVYRLTFGKNKPFLRQFPIPDDETHLDSLYQSVQAAAARPAAGQGKFHVIYTSGFFKTHDRAATLEIYNTLKKSETPGLEFLLMYDASDLSSHPRGTKLTTDQIVDNARWMEEQGIPFGYFAVHGGEAWLSEEAIQRSLEAAPHMLRFVYAAENLEGFYQEKMKGFLPWCERMMALLEPRGKKLILKEKHDSWASIIADPAIGGALFKPEYRGTLVPIWATNQPYQPEAQLGGMLGLKLAGWAGEFGMSTQYFNWGEWELRDVNLARLAPADITLRLELVGAALGGTWIHIEGGQPYLTPPPNPAVDRMARRHRDLVYELIRKGVLSPSPTLANLNRTCLAVELHPEYATLRQQGTSLKSFKMGAASGPLRRGFLAARLTFEPWPSWAFARLAYDQRWHVETCFPKTPLGWVPVVTGQCPAPKGFTPLRTDAEKVWLDGAWAAPSDKAGAIAETLKTGAGAIPLRAAGACMVVHSLEGKGAYRVFLIDPGYLAPRGVETVLESTAGGLESVVDLIGGKALKTDGAGCPLSIPRGAFRVVEVRAASVR